MTAVLRFLLPGAVLVLLLLLLVAALFAISLVGRGIVTGAWLLIPVGVVLTIVSLSAFVGAFGLGGNWLAKGRDRGHDSPD